MSERFNRFVRSIGYTERLLRRLKMQGMSQFGLKGEQVQILYQLYDSEGLTLKEICGRAGLDAGLVSRNLKRLQTEGIVDRLGQAGKYGSVYILSDAGAQIMAEADRLIAWGEKEAVKNISEAELAQFYDTLSKLNKNLEEFPGDWSQKK